METRKELLQETWNIKNKMSNIKVDGLIKKSKYPSFVILTLSETKGKNLIKRQHGTFYEFIKVQISKFWYWDFWI